VKIFDNKGVTLYELLAVMAITMIILPVIYGVFTSGVKLYNKIQVEGQLRDDADYAATMIMNTFYSFPFDYVKDCGPNCLELVDSRHTSVEKVEDSSFYSVNKNEENEQQVSLQIKLTDKGNDNPESAIAINNTMLDVSADFSNSEISFACSNSVSAECQSFMISLNLVLSDERLEDKLYLDSKFGFTGGGAPNE
jgi:Tfp pilus assembly protein PilW